MSGCLVSGCDRPVSVKSRSLCRAHYRRWQRYGDPVAGTAHSHEPHPERIRRYVEIDANGCWIWTAARNRGGYGIIGIELRSALAHRVSYEAFVGEIPNGLELDHLCRVRCCVNPQHLEPVTRYENVRRGWPARRRRAETCPS